MTHKKFSINPIYPNRANVRSSLSMQHVEMKPKSHTADIMRLRFAESLSSNCAGFMTFAISMRYGCATIQQ